MKKLEWYVYVEDFNRRQMIKYNIFDHSRFFEDFEKYRKKYKDNYDQFCKEIDMSLKYYFWSKCEWEIILSSWPSREDFKEEKIDVYDQIMLNKDIFFKYIWDYVQSRRRKKKEV